MNITLSLDCGGMDEDELTRIQADHSGLEFTRPDENDLTVAGDEDAVLNLLRWWLNDDLESIFSLAIRAERVG